MSNDMIYFKNYINLIRLMCRRFWTRNRPGDTVLDRNEEGNTSHRDENEIERPAEEIMMPGLGFEGGLLEQLQQQGEIDFEYISPKSDSIWYDIAFR